MCIRDRYRPDGHDKEQTNDGRCMLKGKIIEIRWEKESSLVRGPTLRKMYV